MFWSSVSLLALPIGLIETKFCTAQKNERHIPTIAEIAVDPVNWLSNSEHNIQQKLAYKWEN